MRSIFLALTVLLVGCGDPEVVQGPVGPMGPPGRDGVGCTIENVGPSDELPNGGAVIRCGSDVGVIGNGADGTSAGKCVRVYKWIICDEAQ